MPKSIEVFHVKFLSNSNKKIPVFQNVNFILKLVNLEQKNFAFLKCLSHSKDVKDIINFHKMHFITSIFCIIKP